MNHYTPSFLIKNRFGTYYFRYLVPKKFTGYSDKRFEIRRSLGTNLRSLAVERARRLLVSIEALITEYGMKQQQQDNPIEWLKRTITELMKRDEMEREQRQDFFARLLAEATNKLEAPLEVMHFSEPSRRRQERKPRLSGLLAMRLSEVIEKYCMESRVHWRPKTEFENRFLLDLITDALGDKQIGSLTLEDMRAYKEAVLSLPKNRSKMPKYRGKSVADLIAMNIPQEERLSGRNALKYLSRGKTFFTWARLNGFMTTEIGSVLTYKLPVGQIKTRVPFNHKELRYLIKSEEYLKGLHKNPHHFWLPLLGMFTGARLNELCQLHCKDIVRRSNIWVILIRDGDDKRVKNRTSIRDVPIHSKLIELGFLNFVTEQKSREEERLFTHLKKHRDGYGGSASKWFCEYQERCGVRPLDPKRELKGFHSFRHTVSTVLAAKTAPLLHERVINQLLGHEKGQSETMKTYAHTISIKSLHEAVEHLKYHLDFSHLLNPKINKWVIRVS